MNDFLINLTGLISHGINKMPISTLTAIDTLQAGDQIAIGASGYGDDRRAALSVLTSYLQGVLSFSDADAFVKFSTQYAAPSATGFTVQITDDDSNTHLILTPAAGYAAGTITLPLSTNLADKQEVLINCTQDITALTVDGNGASVIGEPSSITANDFFRLKYDLAGTTWYRVG